MQRAASAYFQTQVTTTSQGDLVIMLYDAALNFLSRAKEGMAANNMAAKGIAISKVMDILNELDTALNPEAGGELVNNLRGLYCFCTTHLAKANLKKDPAMIDDVVRIISGLRNAYAQIIELPEAQQAAQQAAERLQAAGSSARNQSAAATAPGEGAPAPSAAARGRGMYAKQVRPAAEPLPPGHEDQPAPGFKQAQEAEEVQARTETREEAEARESPVFGGFSPAPSVHRKAAGADMYRRFSGQ
jgi:flagellar protein FliS